jgi:hypothetical protein
MKGKPPAGIPPGQDELQEAVNSAYQALVVAHQRGPTNYPDSGDKIQEAMEALAPFQTVDEPVQELARRSWA